MTHRLEEPGRWRVAGQAQRAGLRHGEAKAGIGGFVAASVVHYKPLHGLSRWPINPERGDSNTHRVNSGY